MTITSFVENNIAIAKFMGGIYVPDWTNTLYKDPTPTIVFTNETAPTPYACYNWDVEELQYHTSIEWLFPVIEKIDTIALDNHGEVGVYISPYDCLIAADIHQPIVKCELSDFNSRHEMVWNAVSEFIKIYNSQKPSE